MEPLKVHPTNNSLKDKMSMHKYPKNKKSNPELFKEMFEEELIKRKEESDFNKKKEQIEQRIIQKEQKEQEEQEI